MVEEILPIGSTVLLEGAKNELMIIGYAGIDATGATHDYSSVPHPAGLSSKSSIRLFDAKDVAEVVYYGYSDLKSQQLITKLLESAHDGKPMLPMLQKLAEQSQGDCR